MDFPGLWQHFSIPARELSEDDFEAGLGFDGSSIRGWQSINESDMLVKPIPETGFIDPFLARKTLVLICNISRSDHRRGLHARSAQHRAQGGSVPALFRPRRHGLYRSGSGILHLRRRALRPERARGLLSHRLGRGTLELGSRREPQPRLQAALQGRLLPGTADRQPAGPAQRDDDDAGEHRRPRSKRSITRWRPPARARSTCASRHWWKWPTTCSSTSTW